MPERLQASFRRAQVVEPQPDAAKSLARKRPARGILRRLLCGGTAAAALVAAGIGLTRRPEATTASAGTLEEQHSRQDVANISNAEQGQLLRNPAAGPSSDWWRPCGVTGSTCRCVGTVDYTNVLGDVVREVNVDGEVQCTAEALGAPSHRDLKICWCQDGLSWGDEVRKGLAAMVRQGLTPRVEIAANEDAEPSCSAESDGLWYGCMVMSKRWDATVVPQVMARTAPPEEQLDMALRKLDACHRMAPEASLRVLGVRSSQGSDAVSMPVGLSRVCSVVYKPDEGVTWTAKTPALHCATEPGTCTTTPCECKRSTDHKIELRTPQGRRCWACSESGKEYTFRVNALAEQMEGTGVSWWPPYGINCPPILWIFMDWRGVFDGCPVISGYMCLLFGCLLLRKVEELSGGIVPWTRVAPLFGPTLKRGEAWRFFTYTFFHLHFLDLFHNLLTLLDTLDVEGTPPIVLGDGSNLKCGVGAKQNFMCYPSIGMGSAHTAGVALLSAAVGGMCSSWLKFGDVVTGASNLGFGLSGSIVALYALYAGAELDQTTSVQRSFQDWVWLRLIFVAFHIAMEVIRGLSQKDAAGLTAHFSSFAAGFMYVLYFLPPMGDGTLLPSEHPYIVACAYDSGEGYVDTKAPECIRLFSSLHEYQVPDVQRKAFMMFAFTVSFTIFNIVVINKRVRASEAVLLAGSEVSAICGGPKRQGSSGSGSLFSALFGSSNMEGKEVFLWCEVMGVSGLKPPQGRGDWSQQLEIRCVSRDPRRGGALLDESTEAQAKTRVVEGGGTVKFNESLFLPVKYKSKSSFVQFVLYDLEGQKTAIASTSLPLSQALRAGNRSLKLQAIGSPAVGVPGRCLGGAKLHVVFRCQEPEQLRELKLNVKEQLDDGKHKLQFRNQQLAAMKQMREIETATRAAEAEAGES